MGDIRIIDVSQTYALRQQVLRPNQPPDTCIWPGDGDDQTRHFGSYCDGVIVAILSIYKNPHAYLGAASTYQLRGMATASPARGCGHAKRLLTAAEQHVLHEGGKCIWANARHSALDFYLKHQYDVKGSPFLIENIGKHYFVSKTLTSS